MNSPFFLIEYEGREVLALDTGLAPGSFAQAKFGSLLADHGALFHADGSWTPWVPEGTLEHAGTVAIFGPAFTGDPPGAAALPSSSGERDTGRFWQLYRRWLALQPRINEAGRQLELARSPWACLVNRASGEALVLPQNPFHRAMTAKGTVYEGQEIWEHPGLRDDRGVVFTAALLAYRILTGTNPWQAKDGETLRQRMRDTPPLPARFAHPGLLPELAALLDAALQGPAPESKKAGTAREVMRPDLESFSKAVLSSEWSSPERLYRSPDEETVSKTLAERTRFERERNALESRKIFFRRHTKTLVIGSLAALLLGFFGYDMAKTARERPNTLGLEPAAVVDMYYSAFTPLDHERMEGCLAKGAPKADVTATMNYFVISRMRQGNERIIVRNDPQPVLDEGRVPAGFIFGTTEIAVEELSKDEQVARYRVQYKLWFPGETAMPGEGVTPDETPAQNEKRIDVVTLEFRKDRWLITAIDRTKE